MADPTAPPAYPSSAAYPPPQPQPGYPPQGYPPPQQPGYPPQPQAAYPPPTADYPGPGYQPPPTGYPSQQTSTSTNVVVVQQQPSTTVVQTTVYRRRYGTNDHGLVYGIVASCLVFWFGGWCGLICTFLGIYYALSAQEREHNGDMAMTQQHHKLSIILSTVGLVVGFAFLIIWIISGAAR